MVSCCCLTLESPGGGFHHPEGRFYLEIRFKHHETLNFIHLSIGNIFSWEPALWTVMSGRDEEEEVQKKSLPFSPLNSDFWA